MSCVNIFANAGKPMRNFDCNGKTTKAKSATPANAPKFFKASEKVARPARKASPRPPRGPYISSKATPIAESSEKSKPLSRLSGG